MKALNKSHIRDSWLRYAKSAREDEDRPDFATKENEDKIWEEIENSSE